MKRKFCAFAIGCFVCLYFSSRSHSTTKRGTPTHWPTFVVSNFCLHLHVSNCFASATIAFLYGISKSAFRRPFHKAFSTSWANQGFHTFPFLPVNSKSKKRTPLVAYHTYRRRTRCGNTDISIHIQLRNNLSGLQTTGRDCICNSVACSPCLSRSCSPAHF